MVLLHDSYKAFLLNHNLTNPKLYFFRIWLYYNYKNKFSQINLTLIYNYCIILPEDEQNRVWSVAFLMKGGDAYVIRTSLFSFYIHIIYRTCNSNCCRCFLICGTGCYSKKIRQQKKHISAWSLEMYLNL